ncbi:MAG: lipoprotein [Candidatus Polarisedimenticolaceae bacterium]|nr:lipoprotein [Candidatus Polarisedimenticolaceae bacterium]
MKPGRRSPPYLVYILLAALLSLAGCGQTGPLYLPDQNEQQEQHGSL